MGVQPKLPEESMMPTKLMNGFKKATDCIKRGLQKGIKEFLYYIKTLASTFVTLFLFGLIFSTALKVKDGVKNLTQRSQHHQKYHKSFFKMGENVCDSLRRASRISFFKTAVHSSVQESASSDDTVTGEDARKFTKIMNTYQQNLRDCMTLFKRNAITE